MLGLDPDALAPETTRGNPSMGVPETALVRRINQRVNGGVLANEDYRRLVRELLAHRTLSLRSGSPRLALPPDVRHWAVELSERWVAELDRRGYDVVGSLDDLRPDPAGEDYVDPDAPDEEAVAQAALDAIAVLLEETARTQAEEHRLRQELAAAHAEIDRGIGTWMRIKRKVVRSADDSRVAAVGLAVYRRARGR